MIYVPNLLKYMEPVEKLKDLKENWDSYGSNPPNAETIQKARDYLEMCYLNEDLELEYGPRVVPSKSGITVSFRNGTRTVATEFFNKGTTFAMFSDGYNDPVIDEITDLYQLNERIVRYLGIKQVNAPPEYLD